MTVRLALSRASLLGRRFEIDFNGSQARTPPLAWLLLTMGLCALLAAVFDFAPRWARHGELQIQLEALQAQQLKLPPAGAASRKATAADSTEIRTLMDEFNRPWMLLFERLESSELPGVHLLQVSVDSRFQAVEMLAEGASLDEVVKYSSRLAAERPVHAVRLTHHEWRASPGARVVVASLTAELVRPDGAAKGTLP
jgi:hypothetical protein